MQDGRRGALEGWQERGELGGKTGVGRVAGEGRAGGGERGGSEGGRMCAHCLGPGKFWQADWRIGEGEGEQRVDGWQESGE